MKSFDRVLKSGCKVEEIQFKTQEALIRCLTVYLIVAWRILYLTHLGRQCPDLPCGIIFEEAEWKSALAITRPASMRNDPMEEPILGEMIQMVAELGGHLGRKRDGPPGAQCLWQGLNRVRDFAIAWTAFGPGREFVLGSGRKLQARRTCEDSGVASACKGKLRPDLWIHSRKGLGTSLAPP